MGFNYINVTSSSYIHLPKKFFLIFAGSIVYAPAQIISAPAKLITAPAQLITAPAQPPATEAVVYTALFSFFLPIFKWL